MTWIAIVVFAIAYVLQFHTRFGSYVMAIGDNESAAANIGIDVDKTKFKVFLWLGCCIGIVGFMGAVRLGRGEIGIGSNLVFPSITAVAVGGTSLSGGKGGVTNTIVGVLIMTVLENGLIQLGANPNLRSAIQGIIILVAVALTVPHGPKVISK